MHRTEKGYATGTGFFVTDDGLFVTNYHVIDGAEKITVVNTQTGDKHDGRLVAKDPVNDIAVLRVDARVPGIPIAKSFGSGPARTFELQ